MDRTRTLSDRAAGRYRRPTGRQVALFAYLARMLWKLSLRIPWAWLGGEDYDRIADIRPMLSRIEARARAARRREGDGTGA